MSNAIKLSLISVALLSQLHAEDSISLKPIAITSTAIATDELKSTDAVEVYTAEDIEKAHVQNVYEFLNKETSVSTLPSYGNPFTQLIDIHGYGTSNGNQNIVIKVNGRKLNNIDRAPQLLSSISPNQIEKIEIIKSSGIVEGGDGANAGVINIITKQTNDKEIGFYAGTYNTFDGNFHVGQSDETLSISVAGEVQKSGGIRAVDTNGKKDENKFSNFSFDLAYNPTDALELRLNGLTSDIDVWYAGSLTQQEYNTNIYQKGSSNAVHQKFSSDVIGTGASYDINDKLSINGDFSHEYKTSAYLPSAPSKYIYNSYNINMKYIDDAFKITAGIDGFNGDRKGSTNIFSKDNIGGFIKSQYKIDKSTLTVGYRYEKVQYKYSPASTPEQSHNYDLYGANIGYNYLITAESSFFINYTKSFQSPNIDDFITYPAPTYQAVVTFNLKPMKTNNYTIGYNYITQKNKLKTSVYYISLKDELYFEPVSYVNTNINKSHKYGLDLYDKYLINQKFNVALNYNYVKAIIDDEIGSANYAGKELPGVSNHSVKTTLNYLPNNFATLSLSQVYRSQAYAANDFQNNFSQKQKAYTSTDISATLAKDNWEVFAKINNLFNQKNGLWIRNDAIYPVNYTTTAMIGLKLKY